MSRTVDKTDVAKAFCRFDIIRLGHAKDDVFAVASREEKQVMRQALMAEWCELLCLVEIDVFNAAIERVVRSNRFWPSLAEILELVDECQREYDAKLAKEIKAEQERMEKQSAEKTKKIDTKALIKLVADGKASKVLPMLVDSDMVLFARIFFPKMSIEMIEKNALEFKNIMKERAACDKCMNRKYCRRNGYRSVPRLGSDGYISTVMERCPANDNAKGALQ